ncbi:hypothetical protein E8E14_003964 [Neopestalotiopsis sp. 37M]|nr:hypothetical protein E8E14_003964 [Neopestalotiopsis sp. 37M]
MGSINNQQSSIPAGSTVLVTGGNGLIASHIVDQFLAAGYRVRATVRTPSKCAWMEPLFAGRHGSGRLELCQVADISAPGAWDEAVRGVAAIAHVAGAVDLGIQEYNGPLEEELRINVGLLEAADREPSVRSVALTSSAWASFTPDPSRKGLVLTEWTWNEDAVRLADSDASPQVKGLANFMALKTRLEQRLWDWIKDKKPHYAFNAILPDTVMGECLDPVHQGVPSTAGMVHWVWKGENHHVLDMVQPQWHVDTRDVGLLYVAALTTPGLDGERLFGFGERFSWFKVREILSGLYPEQEIPQVKDWGMDQTEVPNQRGAELLRGMGRNGWTSLEDSVKANAQSLLVLEKRDK